MRWIYILVITGVITFPVFAASTAKQPSFTKLKEALAFIDHKLDIEDWNGLTQALYPVFRPNEPNRNEWVHLKEDRGNLRLVSAFANIEFPSSEDTYRIHVPFTPIGGSVIKFVKIDSAWRIKATYFLR